MNHLKSFLIFSFMFVVLSIINACALEIDSSLLNVSGDRVMFYSQPHHRLLEGNYIRVRVYGDPVASVKITEINGYYTTATIITGNLKEYENNRVTLEKIDATDAYDGIVGKAGMKAPAGIMKTKPKPQPAGSDDSDKAVKKESERSAKGKRKKATTKRAGGNRGNKSSGSSRKRNTAGETASGMKSILGDAGGIAEKKYPVFDPGYNNIRVKAGSFRPSESDMKDSFTAGLDVVFPLSDDRAVIAEYTYSDPTECTSSSPGAVTHSCSFRNSFAAVSVIRTDRNGSNSWYYGIGGAYVIQRVDMRVTMADTSYYDIMSKIHEPALLLTLGYGNVNGYFFEGRYALTDGVAWDPSTGKEAKVGGFLFQAGYRLHK